MAVGFDGNTFRVNTDDEGRIPAPVADETGLESITLTVFVDTAATWHALLDLRSTITVQPALGGGGIVKTKSGPGVKTLTIPAGNNAEVSRYAVLTGFEGAQFAWRDTYRRAELTFVLGDEI